MRNLVYCRVKDMNEMQLFYKKNFVIFYFPATTTIYSTFILINTMREGSSKKFVRGSGANYISTALILVPQQIYIEEQLCPSNFGGKGEFGYFKQFWIWQYHCPGWEWSTGSDKCTTALCEIFKNNSCDVLCEDWTLT